MFLVLCDIVLAFFLFLLQITGFRVRSLFIVPTVPCSQCLALKILYIFLLNLRRRFVLKVVILFECPIVGGQTNVPLVSRGHDFIRRRGIRVDRAAGRCLERGVLLAFG